MSPCQGLVEVSITSGRTKQRKNLPYGRFFLFCETESCFCLFLKQEQTSRGSRYLALATNEVSENA